jgi:hypothetical protein
VQGWVLYLDADALIIDPQFDLRSYLDERNAVGGIFAGYCEPDRKYTINAGGFAINLSHPVGVSLVLDYWRWVESIPRQQFDASIKWSKQIEDDQGILYQILRGYIEDKKLDDHLIFEVTNESYVNNGPFIHQILRSGARNFDARKSAIRYRVAEIEARQPAIWEPIDPGYYLEATHPTLMSGVGRKTANAITTTGEEGCLLYGPYIDLDPGQWVIRVFGRSKAPRNGADLSFVTDLAIDQGRTILARNEVSGGEPAIGILATSTIELAESVAGLEVRFFVDADQDIEIFAVHFANVKDWLDKDV